MSQPNNRSEPSQPTESTSTSEEDPSAIGTPATGLFPRVILFDIDGTLINGARRREYRGLIRDKLISLFGTCGRISQVEFSGKTDLAIYREALECEGITGEQLHARVPEIEAAMSEVLAFLATGGDVFHVCPGVPELLTALLADRRFLTSLLTGNLERLAEAKLELAGLWSYFKIRGAFGSDHEDRNQLPAIASERVTLHLGRSLDPASFVIVGDTPRDIFCARFFGARVLAVASGQHSPDQLAEHCPDALLPDLSDTSHVIDVLATI